LNKDELYKDGYIQLENKWFDHYSDKVLIQQVTTEGFYLFVNLLQRRTYKNTVTFNKQLISNLFGNSRITNSIIAYQALKSLVDNNIITLYQNIDFNKPKSEDFIEAKVNTNITFASNYYMLADYQFNKIMNYQGKESKHKLLTVFCVIKCKVYDEQATKLSFRTINKITDISEKSIMKYVDILRDELKLILYDNPGMKYVDGKQPQHSPNFYTMNIEHGEYILNKEIELYKEKEIHNGAEFVTKEDSLNKINKRRSNTCKQKRADYMFEHDQLEEQQYNSITDECEKKKEELAWKPDNEVDISKLVNYDEKDNPFAGLDVDDLVGEEEFDLEKFLE